MKTKTTGQSCDNCRKRGSKMCNVFKQENKRPQDDWWCAGYRPKQAYKKGE